MKRHAAIHCWTGIRTRAPHASLRRAHAGLFGHKKGAFTGAAANRAGLLRTAHEGVLFLDDIGELGADEQAMLLKAVEEKRFFPMGSNREVSSDFQLIAGTKRDLRVDVAQGRFREDLYARINLWAYTLPGLTQRPEIWNPASSIFWPGPRQRPAALHGSTPRPRPSTCASRNRPRHSGAETSATFRPASPDWRARRWRADLSGAGRGRSATAALALAAHRRRRGGHSRCHSPRPAPG